MAVFLVHPIKVLEGEKYGNRRSYLVKSSMQFMDGSKWYCPSKACSSGQKAPFYCGIIGDKYFFFRVTIVGIGF